MCHGQYGTQAGSLIAVKTEFASLHDQKDAEKVKVDTVLFEQNLNLTRFLWFRKHLFDGFVDVVPVTPYNLVGKFFYWQVLAHELQFYTDD